MVLDFLNVAYTFVYQNIQYRVVHYYKINSIVIVSKQKTLITLLHPDGIPLTFLQATELLQNLLK